MKHVRLPLKRFARAEHQRRQGVARNGGARSEVGGMRRRQVVAAERLRECGDREVGARRAAVRDERDDRVVRGRHADELGFALLPSGVESCP